MNSVEMIQTNLPGAYVARERGILSRGNMSHYRAFFELLDFVELDAFPSETASVSYILLPLNNADSVADPHFF